MEQHHFVEEGENVEVEEDDEPELALWSPKIHLLELEKADQGLGFSVLDYQVGEPSWQSIGGMCFPSVLTLFLALANVSQSPYRQIPTLQKK